MDILPSNQIQERAFFILLAALLPLLTLLNPWLLIPASLLSLFLLWLFLIQPYLAAFMPNDPDTGDEVANALVDHIQRSGDNQATEEKLHAMKMELNRLSSELGRLKAKDPTPRIEE